MADGLSVDTSSYPKPPAPVNALDTAAKFQGLQQGAQQLQSGQLTISKQKLDLANQSYEYMTRALNALGPKPTKEQIVGMGQNMVDQGLVPSRMVYHMNATIPTDPKQMPAFVDQLRTQAATHQEQIQYYLGQPSIIDNGQEYKTIQVPQSPNQPTRVQSTGIQPQIPPTTPVTDTATTLPNGQPNPNAGQPRLYGTQPLPVAPGAANARCPSVCYPRSQCASWRASYRATAGSNFAADDA